MNVTVLDGAATISAVLYANTAHPELKIDYPNWEERVKQILKKWRALSNEKRAPFLQKARENRSCLRKNSQVSEFCFIFIFAKSLGFFLSLCVWLLWQTWPSISWMLLYNQNVSPTKMLNRVIVAPTHV